jgi:hypothetical protein
LQTKKGAKKKKTKAKQ